jgi:hypothetical protein
MQREFGLIYPLWAHADPDTDLLDRAIGELGLDHVIIPVVTGPLQRLRAFAENPPHQFVTRGGWNYPPDVQTYTVSSLKPRLAEWCGRRDLLAKAVEAAEQRGAAVHVQVDLCGVLSLVEHEPHIRRRNAWGEDSPECGACPLNADLRELLRETLDDLQRYPHTGVQIVDWAPDLPAAGGMPELFRWNPPARRLLDMCFCPACRQIAASADLEADLAARSAIVHLRRTLEQPDDASVERRIEADEVLQRYIAVREQENERWLDYLAEHLGPRRFAVIFREPEYVRVAYQRLAHPVVLQCPDQAPDKFLESLIPWLESARGSLGLVLQAGWPAFRSADELVRFVTQAQNLGVARFAFDALETTSPRTLQAAQQAVRFARRE